MDVKLAANLEEEELLKKLPVPEHLNREVLYQLGHQLPPGEFRTFYYLLTLTGARIGEALAVQYSDFRPSISKRTGKEVWTINLKTEKRRRQHRRTIPITIIPDAPEAKLFGELEPFLNDEILFNAHGEERVFTFHPTRFNNILTKYIKLEDVRKLLGRPLEETWQGRERRAEKLRFYPHFLRRCRAKELWPYYRDVLKMERVFGWTSDKMCGVYVGLDWSDLEVLL